MSDEDSTQNEIAVVRTTFSEVNGPSYANSRNQANIKLVRDFDIGSHYLRFMKIQSMSLGDGFIGFLFLLVSGKGCNL